MKKKIKIIDLLCLISVGEEVPKKIKYNGEVYYWGYDTYTDLPNDTPDVQLYHSLFQRYRIDYCLNDEVEIFDDEEDKDIPLIPDDELIILKQEQAIDMQKAIDYNFKVLQEKINQVVEEFNEFRKGE